MLRLDESTDRYVSQALHESDVRGGRREIVATPNPRLRSVLLRGGLASRIVDAAAGHILCKCPGGVALNALLPLHAIFVVGDVVDDPEILAGPEMIGDPVDGADCTLLDAGGNGLADGVVDGCAATGEGRSGKGGETGDDDGLVVHDDFSLARPHFPSEEVGRGVPHKVLCKIPSTAHPDSALRILMKTSCERTPTYSTDIISLIFAFVNSCGVVKIRLIPSLMI